ncbi:hypothetical protein TWF718_010610 [Orbilia javanica]|uniref:Uncharacterized protein n=1 Tax=Orbilia javanica TaxID=47235 RepID=A0AAN8RA82_9PEZI
MDPIPVTISVVIGGVTYGIRAEVPSSLQVPVENKPLDLPLDSRVIIFGRESVGPGDRDANWLITPEGADSKGPYYKIKSRGGPAMQSGRSLIVPKLVNQLPLLGGAMEYWRLIPVGPGNQYQIQSVENGWVWGVSMRGRGTGSVMVGRPDPSLIQVFTIKRVEFGGINDNRPN